MRSLTIFTFFLTLFTLGCNAGEKQPASDEFTAVPVSAEQEARLDTVYFASGCFWCTEAVFHRVSGVIDVVSGYAGGEKKNPTYEEVGRGLTDHAESVRVVFDPETVNYRELVQMFFASHDPTQVNRQGPDIGKQYRSAIWYKNQEEKSIAEYVKKSLNDSGKYNKPIATEITAYNKFWIAEDYHQNYYELHPNDSYVRSVSRPKVEKFMKEYKDKLKPEYKGI